MAGEAPARVQGPLGDPGVQEQMGVGDEGRGGGPILKIDRTVFEMWLGRL